MFARFDENPAMNLQDIKETKRYGRTDGRTDNVKTVYPLQTKFAGGIMSPIIMIWQRNDNNMTKHICDIALESDKFVWLRCSIYMIVKGYFS